MVAFAWATVGSPYPATAAAKVEGGLLGWLAGVREPLAQTFLLRPWAFAREWVAWLWQTNPLLPLALLALPLAWRRRGRALAVAGLALLAHPLGMALLAPYRGPGFQEGRYSIHLLPLAVIVLAVALDTAPARLRRPALALWLLLALWTLWPASERYAWGVENIEAMQVKLGHWVDANLPPKARVALNDIGAIAYVSRREVVDLMGLVTPEILPYRRAGRGRRDPLRGQGVSRLCDCFPDLVSAADRAHGHAGAAASGGAEARGGLRGAGNGRISAEGLCAMIVSCAARRSSRSR